MVKVEELTTEFEAAWKPFGELRTTREEWLRLAHREIEVTVQPELAGAHNAVEYRSPDFEKDIFDHVDLLMMNPTMFDAVVLEASERAKQTGRDLMISLATLWENGLNKGRWWDAKCAENQVAIGFDVTPLRWNAVQGTDVALSKCFRLDKSCQSLGNAWLGDWQNPDVHFYKYDLPLMRAFSEVRNSKNERLSLDSMLKVNWVGDHELPDRSIWDEKVTVLVRDAIDPKRTCPIDGHDHPMRVISEYVYSATNGIDTAEEANSYDSPFHVSSFFITPGRMSNDPRPHRKFRPLMYPQYVEGTWYNYLRTVLATTARRDSGEEFYIDLTKVPAGVDLPEGGESRTFPRPDPNGREIPGYWGEVKAFPRELSPAFVELLKESRERLNEYRPNRYIFGQAAPTVVSGSTATVYLDQRQQARLPYSRLLGMSDGTIMRFNEAIGHAIQFWDAIKGPTRNYLSPTTGKENLVSGSAAGGDVISLSAEKWAIEWQLVVETSAETEQEREAAYLAEERKFLDGVSTVDNLIRAAGFRDVQGQKEKLYAQSIDKKLADKEGVIVDTALTAMMSALTGINLNGLDQMMAGGQPALPPPTGQNGPPQDAPAPASVTGQRMMPPIVQGPSGGSGAVGGQ